jgi:hypothetical protein
LSSDLADDIIEMWKADRKSSFDQGEQKEALDRFLAHWRTVYG